jgi:hypothetical protein
VVPIDLFTPDPSGSPTLKLRLVVVRNGKEVRTVVEGNATGSIGIRVQ